MKYIRHRAYATGVTKVCLIRPVLPVGVFTVIVYCRYLNCRYLVSVCLLSVYTVGST